MASTVVIANNEDFYQEITLPASGTTIGDLVAPQPPAWVNVVGVTSGAVVAQLDRFVITKLSGTWDGSNYPIIDTQVRSIAFIHDPRTWDSSDANGDGEASHGFANVHATKSYNLTTTFDTRNPWRFRFAFPAGAALSVFDPLLFWGMRLRSFGTAATTTFRVEARLNMWAVFR